MKRGFWFGLLASAGLSAVWLFLWWTAPRINRESFNKIETGMTKSDVIAILNCKPHYAPGELKEFIVGMTMTSLEIERESYIWESVEGRIYVTFANDIRVTSTNWRGHGTDSLAQKIRRWLHTR